MDTFLDFIYFYLPRFMSEEVGLVRISEPDENGECDHALVGVLVFMEDEEIEKCDLIGLMSFFNLFGHAIFCKLHPNLISLEEWRELHEE